MMTLNETTVPAPMSQAEYLAVVADCAEVELTPEQAKCAPVPMLPPEMIAED